MKKLKLKLMSKYSLVFILTSILTFGYFLVNGKSFVWHLDGYAQHNAAETDRPPEDTPRRDGGEDAP